MVKIAFQNSLMAMSMTLMMLLFVERRRKSLAMILLIAATVSRFETFIEKKYE